MERIDKMKELITMVRQVSLLHNKILSMQRQYFEGDWLYMRETHFVMAIGKEGIKTMSELAEILEVTPGAISQLAKRMEDKGYVKRIPSSYDRRINEICLTDKGKELYSRHKTFDDAQYEALIRDMPPYTDVELDFLLQFEQKLGSAFGKFVENEKKD